MDYDLDHDPEDVPIYTGHSLFNTTKCIPSLFIVQSLYHRIQPNIWIKIIKIAIWIILLHVNSECIYMMIDFIVGGNLLSC